MLIVGIILFFCVLAWDLHSDLKKWKAEKPVNHTKEAWVRLTLLIPAVLLMAGFGFWRLPGSFLYSLIAIALTAFMQTAWYWLLFDIFYNKFRGQPIWFNGTDDADDSKLDNFLQKIPDWQEVTIKVGLVGLFTGLWIVYL